MPCKVIVSNLQGIIKINQYHAQDSKTLILRAIQTQLRTGNAYVDFQSIGAAAKQKVGEPNSPPPVLTCKCSWKGQC